MWLRTRRLRPTETKMPVCTFDMYQQPYAQKLLLSAASGRNDLRQGEAVVRTLVAGRYASQMASDQ